MTRPGLRLLIAGILLLATLRLPAQDTITVLHWAFDSGDTELPAHAPGGMAGKAVNVRRIGPPGNQAALFVGNSFVQALPQQPDPLELGAAGDLSICAWTAVPRPPPAGDQMTLLAKGDRGSNPRLLLKIEPSGCVSIRLGAAEAVTVTSRTAIADGAWHHVAVVLDRDTATRIYIDGRLDAEGERTDTISFGTDSPLMLGVSHQAGTSPRRYFVGAIDTVSILLTTLSEQALQTRIAARPAHPDLPPIEPVRGRAPTPRPAGKQKHPAAITRLIDGQHDQVIAELEAEVAVPPPDLESLYTLALGYCLAGKPDAAYAWARRAVTAGLPIERFLAGPRDLLKPLYDHDGFRQLVLAQGAPELIHGPMIGCVTDTSATIWVRTVNQVSVHVSARPADGAAPNVVSKPVTTNAELDYTAVATLSGLTPETYYSCRLHIGNRDVDRQWTFRTAPAPGAPGALRIAFGGGAGYNPQFEHMWTTILGTRPDALLLLGDNVYIDRPTYPAVQRYCYYRRQSRPEFRHLVAQCPVYAIWDDHDFATNDSWGGPEIDTPEWKIPVYTLFRCQWNNPGYGGGPTQPGCWFATRIGDVDVIMLDGRYYRESPKSERPSMLGPAQKAWLFAALQAATGTFKLLVSPVPWARGTKPGSLDTWDGYDAERQEIFSFLETHRIEGVVLLSADRHRSDVWRIDRPNGYDLYEFESSRLTNVHRHGPMKEALFSYNATCSFGLLDIDCAAPDPSLTYHIITIDGDTVHRFPVRRSQLSY